MNKLDIVILAAGKGERMVSRKPKVMHEILGKPLVGYVIDAARTLDPAQIVVVTGYGREVVESFLATLEVKTAFQAEQKGTAHALASARDQLTGNDVLVLLGDVPLIEGDTLREFIDFCRRAGSIVFLTTDVPDPAGYGRMIMDGERIVDIREDAEANDEEKRIRRINTGICYIPFSDLGLVDLIDSNNRKGERYLTDICKVAGKAGRHAKGFFYGHEEEVLGINTLKGLLEAATIMRTRINEGHMKRGVTLLGNDIYIDCDVSIGKGTVISPACHIMGSTTIGEDCFVGPSSMIRDCSVEANVRIEGFTAMEASTAHRGVRIGPFAHLRENAVLKEGATAGNFVEVKNSTLAEGTRADHLSYLGDAEIGRDVNIGAGTITCNYDGVSKNRTIIGDGVFVGSNTELIAPVTIGRGAVVGAGSTITEDVPDGALAVSRTPQKNVEGYRRK